MQTRSRRSRRSSVFASLLLPAMVSGGASELSAQPSVFHACYVPLTGTVYRIKETNLKQACASTSHVEFSWTDGVRAIRTGDAAGGDLSGLFPDPTVAKLLGRALSSTPPSPGQVLTFDGNEWVPMTPSGGGGGGTTDHGALAGLTDDDHPQYLLTDGVRTATDGFAVTGSFGTGSIPVQGPGVRLMWYPGKAAFRVGRVTSGNWDDSQIGQHSVAMGNSSGAPGDAATAMGFQSAAIGDFSTAMGFQAVARGDNATAMGFQTNATGNSSVAMGAHSFASGDFSTALGSFVSTNGKSGTFIYGDRSTTTLMRAGGDNEFIVRAAHGTYIFSNSTLTSGVFLNPGAGAWGTVSDVNRKHLFRDEVAETALAKVAAMPIRSWSYKSQDPSIRHLGPTAQDFHAAFGFGESDTTITTTDIDGVALLAIQALAERTRELREKTAEIDALRVANAELGVKVRELERLCRPASRGWKRR